MVGRHLFLASLLKDSRYASFLIQKFFIKDPSICKQRVAPLKSGVVIAFDSDLQFNPVY